MGKNVAVFVDVANIFYAAKAAGVDIDYVTLLKSAIAGRDFVRAYAYTGLDPDNENQRNFHSFLARHGYKVVSKDIRKYGDGKVKANLDIELVVDMLKTARNLDVAIVVSGDGDFAPAIRAVQEMGVRVEVISFRGNTSADLIEVADIFTDITQLAKVERGSSRSGRRVAEEEFDMAGTDIPDKQTEGASQRQRRSRGRGRGDEAGRGRDLQEVEGVPRRGAEDRDEAGRPIVVLPGEKLSRAGRSAAEAPDDTEDLEELEDLEGRELPEPVVMSGDGAEEAFAEPRRRRRRGGRGRGRGRGRMDEAAGPAPEDEGAEAGPAGPVAPAGEGRGWPEGRGGERRGRWERPADRGPRPDRGFRPDRPDREPDEEVAAARGPRPTPIGSIWDSQLGMPTGPAAPAGPLADVDEDLEEPEIPEYLLAERRRGQGGGGGRGRGQGGRGRSGYSAAVDRERFGRSGSGGLNRYGEAARPPQQQQRPQHARPPRRDERPAPIQPRPDRQPRSEEPWSEVPPEIEELLRAQMASRPQRPASEPRTAFRAPAGGVVTDEVPMAAGPATSEEPVTAARRGRGRRPAAAEQAAPAEAGVAATAAEAPEAAPKPRRGRPPKSAPTAEAVAAEETAPATRPRRGRPARSAAAESSDGAPETAVAAAAEPATPATRTRRLRGAAATSPGEAATEGPASGQATAPRRRRTARDAAPTE